MAVSLNTTVLSRKTLETSSLRIGNRFEDAGLAGGVRAEDEVEMRVSVEFCCFQAAKVGDCEIIEWHSW